MATSRNDNKVAFDLKGSAFTILVLSLRTPDMDAVSAQLNEKTRAAQDFFRNAPVVIDFRYLTDDDQVDLAMLVNLIRGQGLIPVGITGCTEEQKRRAEMMELAVLATRAGGKKQQEAEGKEDDQSAGEEYLPVDQETLSSALTLTTKEDTEAEHTGFPSLIITDPVRSGQSVTAERNDLVIMAAVSSGAEITASGNIHVYGTLRGRAFAGNNGDPEARIFCQRLEAELISIAGVHLVNEDFPANLRSKPVQIQLRADRLHITVL